MIYFHMLGTLDLRGPEERHLASPVTGAKRPAYLAYLAYLALSTQEIGRELGVGG